MTTTGRTTDGQGEARGAASSDELTLVVKAAQGLGPIPAREDRWAHLPLCVLDAVYSIGAQYSGTARTVRAYAALEDLVHVVEPAQQVADGVFATTEQPVHQLRDRIDRDGPETFARLVVNRQRTSPRGGVLKAQAAAQYADILRRLRPAGTAPDGPTGRSSAPRSATSRSPTCSGAVVSPGGGSSPATTGRSGTDASTGTG